MESRDMPIFTRTFDLLTWLLPAPMSDRFSEGFDTVDLTAAKSLLDELSAAMKSPTDNKNGSLKEMCPSLKHGIDAPLRAMQWPMWVLVTTLGG